MTDDLVKRLRKGVMCGDDPIVDEAADRIEKLEENIELQLEWYLSNKRVLDGRIEKLVEALRLADAALSGANMNMKIVEKKIRKALEAES